MSRILALLKTGTNAFPSDLVDAITAAGGSPVQIWSGDSGFSAVIAEGDAAVQSAMSAHAAVACATSTAIPAAQSLDVPPQAAELANAWNTYVSNDYQTAVDGFYSQSIPIDQMLPPGGCSQGAGDEDDGGGSAPLVASGGPDGSIGSGASGDPGAGGDPGATAGASDPSAGDATSGSAAALSTATVGIKSVARSSARSALWLRRRPGGFDGGAHECRRGANLGLALMHAFDVYYDLAPKAAHLVFECNVRRTTLTLDPTTVPTAANPPAAGDYEACEAPWRDAALKALGQSSGWSGIDGLIYRRRSATRRTIRTRPSFTSTDRMDGLLFVVAENCVPTHIRGQQLEAAGRALRVRARNRAYVRRPG